MYPGLENLLRQLSSLPGIGRRSALRIALWLLRSDLRQVEQLSETIAAFRRKMRFCRLCGGLAEAELCHICCDPQRDSSLLCVVEEPGDILAIERTAEFCGYYHVLMGALSPLDGIGPEELRIRELLERLEKGAQKNQKKEQEKDREKEQRGIEEDLPERSFQEGYQEGSHYREGPQGHFQELFLATNPTLEGDATASYLQERLQGFPLRITRISHGIPTGSSIEFADQGTLARSIRGRLELSR